MKIYKINYRILKNIRDYSLLVVALITFGSCCKGDDLNEQPVSENQAGIENTIYGNWKVLSGNLALGQSKYVHFNNDNTMYLLEEDDLGFRSDLIAPIVITDHTASANVDQFGIAFSYEINADKLTITKDSGTSVLLERATEIPSVDEWIKTLLVLDKVNMPFSSVDITFDGEHILRYYGAERKIQKIDPHSFEIIGTFSGGLGASALDIEKSDHPLRQLFKASGGETNGFRAYIYQSNEYYHASNGIRAPLTGLASERPGYIWAASSQERTLYYYKSNGALRPGEVLETISLDFNPGGVDYREGFLYITRGPYIYKCSTEGEFSVMTTYKLDDYGIRGITYDGTNFILNTFDQYEDIFNLLRIDLSI